MTQKLYLFNGFETQKVFVSLIWAGPFLLLHILSSSLSKTTFTLAFVGQYFAPVFVSLRVGSHGVMASIHGIGQDTAKKLDTRYCDGATALP